MCENRTFLFIVNAWNGAIIQARMFKSGGDMDQGLDIVYRPPVNLHTPGFYMIVGNAQRAFSLPQMWVVRMTVGASGSGTASGTMYLVDYTYDFTANAVSLSTDGTKAVVAGRIGYHLGPLFAFATELSFSENAVGGWAKYYMGSTPNPDAHESISRITGDPAAPGYFIISGGLLPGSDLYYDMHAIRVNNDGENMTGCPVTPFWYNPVSKLEPSLLTSVKANTPGWYVETLEKSIRNCEVDRCASQLSIGSNERLAEAALSNSLEFTLSPNPTAVGSIAQIRFDSPEAQTVLLNVWDLTGRQVKSGAYDLQKGEQNLELSATGLPSGVYLVRINGKSGDKAVKWLIQAR